MSSLCIKPTAGACARTGRPRARRAAASGAVTAVTASKDALRAIEAPGRRNYVVDTTPIEYLPRLTAECGGKVELYVKRDDLLPLAGGGSKTRKLDYLVHEAVKEGADVLVTSGAVQSNHCRLTASAAAREGMECHIVLEERVEGSYNPSAGGNNYAFKLLGAHQRKAEAGNVGPVQDELVAELEAEGKKVYTICGGGSDDLGALGYGLAAMEIIEQSEQLKREHGIEGSGNFFDAIVTCSGSGGTHTGLVAGLRAAGDMVPVIGISVRFDAETQAGRIREQYSAAVKRNFADFEYFSDGAPPEDIVVRSDWVGPGYSLPTDEMAEAVELFARKESILLDPVYTGKGAAGLIGLARSGDFPEGARLLFIHTGGAPSLFHYETLYHHDA